MSAQGRCPNGLTLSEADYWAALTRTQEQMADMLRRVCPVEKSIDEVRRAS